MAEKNNKFYFTDNSGKKIEQITPTNILNLKGNMFHTYTYEGPSPKIKMADGIVTECGAKFEMPTSDNDCKLVYNVAPVELE